MIEARVVGHVEGRQLPLCTAGENACPPEDVGGPHGFERFLAALAEGAGEESAAMRDWIGGVFDPRGFDLNRVNRDWSTFNAGKMARSRGE